MTTILIWGAVSAFGLGPTVGTLAYRQDMGQIDRDLREYDVFVAVADCSLIGREGILIADSNVYKALVFDCSGDVETTGWMECEFSKHNHDCAVGVEVDYWFWEDNPELIGQNAALVLG